MTKTVYVIVDKKSSLEDIIEAVLSPYDGYDRSHKSREEAQEELAQAKPSYIKSEEIDLVIRKISVTVE